MSSSATATSHTFLFAVGSGCQWRTIHSYIWLSNLPAGLPVHVNGCLCCPCLSFRREDIMLHCVHTTVYVCVFVFNKLREVDVWPASSYSLPAWSCWWIVGPRVSVSVCVCVLCYRLRDIRWVLWWIPPRTKLKQHLKKQWLCMCVCVLTYWLCVNGAQTTARLDCGVSVRPHLLPVLKCWLPMHMLQLWWTVPSCPGILWYYNVHVVSILSVSWLNLVCRLQCMQRRQLGSEVVYRRQK